MPHNGITIKSPGEIKLMREAGQIVANAKAAVQKIIEPGIETRELDEVAEREIRGLGAVPSFKGYRAVAPVPFPATICTSINEELVHGIPGNRKLKAGDIISVDVGAIYEGLHGDSAFTAGVGDIDPEAERLIDATRESLNRGIAKVRAGARIGDISVAVQTFAEKQGYAVVTQYVGHGIGFEMHEDPQVPNYGEAGRGPLIRKGMALAIEPMLNVGTRDTKQLDDGWTVVTADGSLCAHFEHTVVITERGAEVTTRLNGSEA
ncbi:MAG: type I methionyl aminopeptidase [SAR202 cluster bacterium]|jgi:methionyl aminopeptidase|nr:type I methionyl aminopeptidase [SAR202 cluster bacterium]MDP7225139.1 type I methionyl aminopeptidase [SAR202 cluster bacterium]|tara:strand:+ start:2934 stop:3722 length:789 start_codon:yes stop_codon:yes gene_type:complete